VPRAPLGKPWPPLHALGAQAALSQQPPAPQGFQAGHEHGNCKAELALRMIQGRWKLLILRDLINGQQRFSDLQCTVHAQVPASAMS